jgi:serine protease inhibitor
MALTQFAIVNAVAKDKPVKLSDRDGLHLLVTPGGSKLWRFRYRFAGRENMLAFGSFPAVPLAAARSKRDEARTLLADGKDPAVKRKLDKIAADTASRNTFGAVVSEYLENLEAEGASESTMNKNRWLLEDLAALYFRDDWERQFDKAATRPGSFHGLDRVAEVSMMQQKASYSFRREGRFAAVDLSYVHKRYSLVALTTTDRPAAASEFASVAHWLDGNSFSTGRARLELPRFAVTEQSDLLGPLKTMGLAESLASPTAFEGLAAAPLAITGILQRTVLKLGEEGTEAAAVTGAVFATRAKPVEEMAIVIDKPFLFALRDRDTGLILMSGYMGRPASSPVA